MEKKLIEDAMSIHAEIEDAMKRHSVIEGYIKYILVENIEEILNEELNKQTEIDKCFGQCDNGIKVLHRIKKLIGGPRP